MYDVIRQVERIGSNYHHQHHHHRRHSSVNHICYHPASFRRVDPHPAYCSLYGLYASDAVLGSSCGDNGAMLPTGVYGSNYSPVSSGSTWAENMPSQHPKWSRPVIVDTRIQWDQRRRQYGCSTMSDVSGVYRHASVISNSVTPTVSGTSGLAAASRLSQCSSPGLASASLAAVQRQQHSTASCAPSSVTCGDKNNDDDVTLRCGAPSSPRSATYQSNSVDATSNVLF